MKHPSIPIFLFSAAAALIVIPGLSGQDDRLAEAPSEEGDAASNTEAEKGQGSAVDRGKSETAQTATPERLSLLTPGEPAWLGIAVDELEALAFAQLDLQPGIGLAVLDLAPGGPAEKAGLRRHDILLALNDRPLTSRPQFLAEISAWQPGDRVTIELLRRNRRQSVNLVMGRPGDTDWKGWRENLPDFKATAELDALFGQHEERFKELKSQREAMEARAEEEDSKTPSSRPRG